MDVVAHILISVKANSPLLGLLFYDPIDGVTILFAQKRPSTVYAWDASSRQDASPLGWSSSRDFRQRFSLNSY